MMGGEGARWRGTSHPLLDSSKSSVWCHDEVEASLHGFARNCQIDKNLPSIFLLHNTIFHYFSAPFNLKFIDNIKRASLKLFSDIRIFMHHRIHEISESRHRY